MGFMEPNVFTAGPVKAEGFSSLAGRVRGSQ